MNKFILLKYWGYLILSIPTVLILFMVTGFFIYLSNTTPKTRVITKIEKGDVVEIVKQPIIINNPVVEKSTTTTTTIIQPAEVKPEPVRSEPVKTPPVQEHTAHPELVTPPVIDTTKTQDTL